LQQQRDEAFPVGLVTLCLTAGPIGEHHSIHNVPAKHLFAAHNLSEASYVCQKKKADRPKVKHGLSALVKVVSLAAEATPHCTHLDTVLEVNLRKQPAAAAVNQNTKENAQHQHHATAVQQ